MREMLQQLGKVLDRSPGHVVIGGMAAILMERWRSIKPDHEIE